MGDLLRLRPAPRAARAEPLWRHLLGGRIRLLRLGQGLRLVDLADRAGISPQYLSEIERGRKEPSSEVVAAILGALGVRLLDLTRAVADDLQHWAGDVLELGSAVESVRPPSRTAGPRVLAVAA